MKKSIWLSYDLGIKGEYESLYRWLANHDALECGDNLAYFTIEISTETSVIDLLKSDLEKNVAFSKNDRIYIIWREGTTVKGKFLFGSRKAPPWAGYGPFKTTPEESA